MPKNRNRDDIHLFLRRTLIIVHFYEGYCIHFREGCIGVKKDYFWTNPGIATRFSMALIPIVATVTIAR